jgi:hypothetical protein
VLALTRHDRLRNDRCANEIGASGPGIVEGIPMFGSRQDDRSPLHRALEAAASLKPGTWESVESLAVLAAECKGMAEAEHLYQTALRVAAQLKAGTYESVRALAWLSRADRELHSA